MNFKTPRNYENTFRSSRPDVFCKKGVPRNFEKFTGKHLCQKKRLWHRCFLENFAKFLRTPFLIEHFWWLLLNFLGLQCFQEVCKQNICLTQLKEKQLKKNYEKLLSFYHNKSNMPAVTCISVYSGIIKPKSRWKKK